MAYENSIEISCGMAYGNISENSNTSSCALLASASASTGCVAYVPAGAALRRYLQLVTLLMTYR